MTTKTKLIIAGIVLLVAVGVLAYFNCAVLGERGDRAGSCHWLRGRLEDEEME